MRRRVCLILMMSALVQPRLAWTAADQLEEIQQEQTKARQEQKAKELKAREQLEAVKRDQQANQAQQQ